MKYLGIVKWFDSDKGFGVIGTPDDGDYFLHIKSFSTKPGNISQKAAIIFSKKIDNKNRSTAENSRLIGDLEDWKIIFDYLGKPNNVSIEIELKGTRRRGNLYHRKEIRLFSLIQLSTKQFFVGKSEAEISNIITNYFDINLRAEHFISYCESIERRIIKDFPNETAKDLLNNVFSHFGKNLDEEILFEVWKQQKFKFISYTDKDDYEIPEIILTSKMSELKIPELRRILDYSFGLEFCNQYISHKFNNLENIPFSEIKELYQLLELENENSRQIRRAQLDNYFSQKVINTIAKQINSFDLIRNDEDFNKYKRLLLLIPSQLNEENKASIEGELNKSIILKCSDEFKTELWIKEIIKEVPFEFILKDFIDANTKKEKRISILSKLHSDKQFELLKSFSGEYDFEKAFELIEGLVKKDNSLGYNFNLSKVLFDVEFWKDKKYNKLLSLFIDYTNNECSEELKFELFLKGLSKDVPPKIVFQKIDKLDLDDCYIIFKSQPENFTLIRKVLEAKILNENISTLNRLYDLAQTFLDNEGLSSFDKKVFESIEQCDYFTLWKRGIARLFPKNYIDEVLNEKFENYRQIENWINNNVVPKEEITNFLLSYLNRQVPITDRIVFYKQVNHIKYLLQLNEIVLEEIKSLQNDFYGVILWFLDKEDILNFELLKQRFIYFYPDDQVRIVHKLFFLKASGNFDLTLEKLDELTRFDLDLYNTYLKFNQDDAVDISTDVVIKALLSYEKNQRFFVESELLTIVLNDLKLNRKRRFKLSNYFEVCLGRQKAEFNWSKKKTISKVVFGNNDFYFSISFEYNSDLVESIKKIPGRIWNQDSKEWFVPSQYENEVIEFAKTNRFFLDFEGSNYSNNIHLANFIREEKPNGISFCEGRLANRLHEMFKKEFWWCAGQPCFSKCETIHSLDEWEKYTLLDFCIILGFEINETNRMGDFIPKGLYYQFIGLINRFNRLLEKIYCQDCDHILFPVETGHFAAYNVVRFHCVNGNCINKNEIYLNHCLNGQCNCIIDSRISKKCSNGLFICENCGSCCSHEMLTRRLKNLEATGGYIHDNLRICVNEKLGHLERAEYFCYNCGGEMTEFSNDVFHCTNCNIKYDTTKYKFKRPHLHLKKSAKNNNDDDETF